jgi:hypothetical protein
VDPGRTYAPCMPGVSDAASASLTRARPFRPSHDSLVAAGLAATVAATAAAHGAYFPTAWGWTAMAFGSVALLALIVRPRIALGRLELASAGALLALTAWVGASIAWSTSPPGSVLEFERMLVYATALPALLLTARRRGVTLLVGGLLAGIAGVCTYSLVTRFFPERLAISSQFAVNRLEQPLGYWNSLGAFAAMGILLALGVALRTRSLVARALAAASLPILACTLYFTFGRSAWIALGLALLTALLFDARRLQLVTGMAVLAPAPVIAVWVASRQHALTSRSPLLSQASHEGHRLAPVVLGLAALAAVSAAAFGFVEARIHVPRAGRIAYACALVAVAVVGAAAIWASYGSPWAIAQRGYHAFTAPPATGGSAPVPAAGAAAGRVDLNKRLFSFYGNGRPQYWKVAWRQAAAHPVGGAGAGTFEIAWDEHRTFPGDVRDAHGLYIETLGELGWVGLGLLVLLLALPVVAAVRARSQRFVGAVVGAYAVYIVHAVADWDWELTAVTLAALALGGILLVCARPEEGRVEVPTVARFASAAVLAGAIVFAFVGLVGNLALSESNKAEAAENWARAETQARKATRWAPWSSEAWKQLGEVQLQTAKLGAARASFRKALAKDPEKWDLWLDLAFASTGRARQAAARRAYELNPLSPEIAAVKPALGLG